MSTQYDAIASGYSDIHSDANYPASQFETANVHAVLSDHIKGKRVLDLACGTGYYSRKYLEWGADSVVGVDISSGMIERAQDESMKTGIDEAKLTFLVGDASKPLDLTSQGAPFDVVASAWLLNYAPDAETMEGMWRTIESNLKPGGIFVGLTSAPASSNRDVFDRIMRNDHLKYGCSAYVKREVDEGFEVHVVLGFPGSTQVEFDNFYLRNEVYERTSRSGGMTGGFEWQPFVLPPGYTRGFWNLLLNNPYCRVCMAWK